MAGSMVEVRTSTTTYRGRLIGGSPEGRGPHYLYLADPVDDPHTPFMAVLSTLIKSVRVIVSGHDRLPPRPPSGTSVGWLAGMRPWYRA